MASVNILSMSGKPVGTLELADAVFGVPMNESAVHQVVVAQLANRRQGTQSTLTRAEVSGGGKKPWRQKGTGRARQGSTRSPQWRHGGIVFAPKPRSYRVSVNKKIKRLAMLCALSDKLVNQGLVAVDALQVESGKTRDMAAALTAIGATGKALLIGGDDMVRRASSNLPQVVSMSVNNLNVVDIINADYLVASADTLRAIQEVYA